MELFVSYAQAELVFSSGLYCQMGSHTFTAFRPDLCRMLRLAWPLVPTERSLLTTKAVEVAALPDGRSAAMPTPV